MPNQGQGQRGCMSGCPIGQEVTPECEVFLEGDGDDPQTRFRNCVKNPNHSNFFSCSDFKVDDLPPENRTRRMMDEVFQRCVQTVRVKVQFVSCRRPDTFADSEKPYPFTLFRGSDRVVRYGTGKVIAVFYPQGVEGKLCPCPLCKKSTQPKKYWWIRVRTAMHVIYDRSEAERASFECFFDNVNDLEQKKVRTIYGYDTFNIVTSPDQVYRSDVCDVLCVTHENDVASLLYTHLPLNDDFLQQQTFISKSYAPSRVIVSHPHGRFKRITVGTVLHLTSPISQHYPSNTPLPFKDGTVYRRSTCTTFHTCDIKNQEGYSFCNSDEKTGMETRESEIKKNRASYPACSNSNDTIKDARDNFITTEQYNMKEKLEAIKNQLRNTNTIKTFDMEESDEVTKLDYDYDGGKLVKDDCIAEFYRIFIREQVLMIFVIFSFVRQKIKNPQAEMDKAFQDLYDVFIKMPLDNTSNNIQRATNLKTNTRNENGMSTINQNMFGNNEGLECPENCLNSDKVTTDMGSFDKDNGNTNSTVESDHDEYLSYLYEWRHLLNICEKQFAELKCEASRLTENSPSNENNRNQSFFSSVFFESDKIVGHVLFETKQRQKDFDENVLPFIFEQVFLSVMKTFEKFENGHCSEISQNEVAGNCSEISHNIKEKDRHNVEDTVQLNVQNETNAVSGIKEIVRDTTLSQKQTKDATKLDAYNDGVRVNEAIPTGNPNNNNAEVINVPVGSTFTLPLDAEYAFRVYSQTPGWISFPHGTKMTKPDGQTIQIGEPLFQFKVDFFVPEQSYVTYDIATCPGSSGASVFFENALSQNVTSVFPHSGHLEEGGLNRSGIRLNVYSVYSKLILSGSNEIMQCLTKGDTDSQCIPSLWEVSKVLVNKMKGIFMKSVNKTVLVR